MTDGLDELKKLIETLDVKSNLRKSLEDALYAEQKRETVEDSEGFQETELNADDEKQDDENQAEEKHSGESFDLLDGITDKLDELLDNDEFIAASAGFLLGAVSVGVGALAISALKK